MWVILLHCYLHSLHLNSHFCKSWCKRYRLGPCHRYPNSCNIIILVWAIVLYKRHHANYSSISRKQNWIFLIFPVVPRVYRGYFILKHCRLGPVSQVAPIDKLSIALTILLSVIFLKEALTIKTIIGAVLIIAGTLVIAIK